MANERGRGRSAHNSSACGRVDASDNFSYLREALWGLRHQRQDALALPRLLDKAGLFRRIWKGTGRKI
jgi:hypothetical protein